MTCKDPNCNGCDHHSPLIKCERCGGRATEKLHSTNTMDISGVMVCRGCARKALDKGTLAYW